MAYYATEPIAARVAKAKDGLRVGMRIVEADWRIGGKARMVESA